MRNNQPVTNEEYIIPEGLTLVSKTDLVGNIIECNDAFEAASGYSRDQLIGQPHNIIRHPDVPPAVFADLWHALKQGETWSQIVKNRREDGGFYWVRANATPIYTNGKVSGYMSVRTSATAAEKQAATQAYKDINAGKAKIRSARIFYGIDWNKLNFFSKLSPQFQLPLLMFLLYMIPLSVYAIANEYGIPTLLGIIVLGLVPPFLYGLKLQRTYQDAKKDLLTIASREHLSNQWFDPKTPLGKMKTAIRSVYLAAREQIEESAYQLDQAQLLQTAMDQVSTNIMITDANLNITYMNNDMVTFLNEKEAVLQTVLPEFKVQNLIGQNIDLFHKDPSHQRDILASLTQPYLGKVNIGEVHLELYIIPVFNRAGIRTATIAEWRDKTAEVQLLQEVNTAIQEAKSGRLDSRIDLSRVDGVAKELSQSINDLISAIERPINETVKIAVSLSEGNLTKHIEGQYSGLFAVLQDSLNVAVDSLNSMIAQTKEATTAVSNGAEQIYQGSIDLNNRTQNQAASLEETASSMEEMTAAVKQNADNSREASNVTQTTAQQASSGVEVMHRAINAMEQINESSQKINDIIGLIDSIAFQTNLLALNAAVEAARAGEHGRGFAVVAGEVRNLAGKSSEAAKDIRNLIEDTVKKVSEGTIHVKGSGDVLNEIVDSISNVNQIIEEIAASSNEQSEGVSLVNSSITNIDTAVQQNAALVEETAATSEELGDISKRMQTNISQFTINDSGASMHQGSNLFDFEGARRAHRQWRVKARAYVNDIEVDFDPNKAKDPTLCALGQWINNEGQAFSDSTTFQALNQKHSALHAQIETIINLKHNNDTDAANTAIEELTQQSEKVIELITQLENEISASSMNHNMTQAAAQPATTATPSIPAVHETINEPIKTYVKKEPKPAALQTPAPAQPSVNSDDEWTDF